MAIFKHEIHVRDHVGDLFNLGHPRQTKLKLHLMIQNMLLDKNVHACNIRYRHILYRYLESTGLISTLAAVWALSKTIALKNLVENKKRENRNIMSARTNLFVNGGRLFVCHWT